MEEIKMEIVTTSIAVFVRGEELTHCYDCGKCANSSHCYYEEYPIIQTIKNLNITPESLMQVGFVLLNSLNNLQIETFDGSEFVKEENGEFKFNFGDD